MAKKIQKATTTASTNAVKASWYGSREAMMDAALLRGNIGRVLRCKGFLCLTAEKKADVTKELKKLVPDAEIEYHNPIVCRKRKGSIVEIDGVTRIWAGVVSVQPKEVKATKSPKKATKAKAKAKAAKQTEADEIQALKDQIAQMQEVLNAMAEVL